MLIVDDYGNTLITKVERPNGTQRAVTTPTGHAALRCPTQPASNSPALPEAAESGGYKPNESGLMAEMRRGLSFRGRLADLRSRG